MMIYIQALKATRKQKKINRFRTPIISNFAEGHKITLVCSLIDHMLTHEK